MTGTISEDALRGQQSRIMAAMRAQASPQPSEQLNNITQSLLAQSSGQGNYFDMMKKFGDQQKQAAVAGETGIYNQMKEQVARGDTDAAAVDKAITDVAGADPKLYASIADSLHNDPQPINKNNASSMVMKHAAALGINPLSVQIDKAKIAKLNTDAAGGEKPSLVKTMEAYQKASPEERAIMDRFGKVYEKNTMMDANGNIVPIPGAPNAVKTIEESKASGKGTGKSNAEFVAKAQQALPTVLDNASYLTDQIDAVVNHPAKKYAVGAASMLPVLPGTPQADFKARLDQINGSAFLQAFDNLRGAGAITEVEGTKATQARNRMNKAQKAADFDKAAKEYTDIIKQGIKRATAAARGQTVGAENIDRTITESPENVNKATMPVSEASPIIQNQLARGKGQVVDYTEYFK